jgi:hypothetical protein
MWANLKLGLWCSLWRSVVLQMFTNVPKNHFHLQGARLQDYMSTYPTRLKIEVYKHCGFLGCCTVNIMAACKRFRER